MLAFQTRRAVLRCCFACAGWALVLSPAMTANFGTCAERPVAWKTGKEFDAQLNSTIGFVWESSPIREGLHGLAANQGVAIWLDRRVDPDHEVDLEVRDATLDEALRRVAGAVGGGISYVGPVAYVGSNPVTAKLATLAARRRDEIKQLPTAARVRLSSSSAWSWEALATPRELLAQLAQQANVQVVNIDQIPHDLWPAGDLPPLAWTDRMTLLLAGFDLTFEIARDGSAIRLAPMPPEVSLQRSYAPRGSLDSDAAMIRKAFPGVAVEKAAARLAVTGSFEEHQGIERLLRGEPVRREAAVPGSKRFDLRVENQPAGAIIKAVAKREQLQIDADASSLINLQQRISLDVKQLTLKELLDHVLRSTGITHRIEDGVLTLRSP